MSEIGILQQLGLAKALRAVALGDHGTSRCDFSH
jgi:hypothetical protein